MIRRSTSRPYGKWYDSGCLMLPLWYWSDEDKVELYYEQMEDELERLRAADMMADRFVNEVWSQIQVAILPSVEGFSSWEIIKRQYARRDQFRDLLREFWRERV